MWDLRIFGRQYLTCERDCFSPRYYFAMVKLTLYCMYPFLNQDSAGSSKGGRVTWEDAKQCNDYVNTLQAAAERVAAQNRKLRAVHTRLIDDVSGLLRK